MNIITKHIIREKKEPNDFERISFNVKDDLSAILLDLISIMLENNFLKGKLESSSVFSICFDI